MRTEGRLTCEHRSQTNRQWRILPPDDSPTQSCAMTGPLSKKWECCRTQTDTIQPRRLQRLQHESEDRSTALHIIDENWSTQDATWKCCVGKWVENRVLYTLSNRWLKMWGKKLWFDRMRMGGYMLWAQKTTTASDGSGSNPAFFTWALKHLVTLMRSPLCHMFCELFAWHSLQHSLQTYRLKEYWKNISN